MPNMKALSQRIKKLRPMLNFFQKYVKGHGQGQMFKIHDSAVKVLSQGTHMPSMKALSLIIEKLWPMLIFFFKSRSKVTVKVTRSKFMVPLERPCHNQHTFEV